MKKALKVIGAILSGAVTLFGSSVFITGDPSLYPFGIPFILIGAVPLFFCLRKSPEDKARAEVRRAAKDQRRQAMVEEARLDEQRRQEEKERRRQTKAEAQNRPFTQARNVGVTNQSLTVSEALTLSDYVVLDVETTGLDPDQDEIIEVAAIRTVGGVSHAFHSLIKPYRQIPDRITELTGITNADVRSSPRISEVAPVLANFIGGLPLVAHNAPFDIGFLSSAFQKAGISTTIPYVDTLALSREAFPSMHNYKLATLIRVLHLIDGEQQHRAGSDTEATLKLFKMCQAEIPRRQEREQRKREKEAEKDKAFYLNQCGMQAEASGNIEKAIRYYEDVVFEKAPLPNAYMRLAVLYKKRQQWDDVVRVCDAALAVLPGTPGKLCQPEEYEKRKAYALAKMTAASNTG